MHAEFLVGAPRAYGIELLLSYVGDYVAKGDR